VPKLKTHKGAKARLGVSGRGKLLRRKISVNNYRRKKHRRSRGLFDEMIPVNQSDRRRLRRLLPYDA
jgi:large subunit ribosomal protein L35